MSRADGYCRIDSRVAAFSLRGFAFFVLLFFSFLLASGPSGCGNASSGPPTTPAGESGTPFSVDTAAAYVTQTFSGMASLVSDASQNQLGLGPREGASGALTLPSAGGTCHPGLVYKDGCMTMTVDCAPNDGFNEIHGSATFDHCVTATTLGLMAVDGRVEFDGSMRILEACRLAPSLGVCSSMPVSWNFVRAVGLTVQFAGGTTLGIDSVRVDADGLWTPPAFRGDSSGGSSPRGGWHITIADLTLHAADSGLVLRCSDGSCVLSSADQTAPETPVPAGAEGASVPLDCTILPADGAWGPYLDTCPDDAALLTKLGYDLDCVRAPGGNLKKCEPQPRSGLGVEGQCDRSGSWQSYCPVTYQSTIDGAGAECSTNEDCHIDRMTWYYGVPASDVLFLSCVNGCCTRDYDQDGYSEDLYPYPNHLQNEQDNCPGSTSPGCAYDCWNSCQAQQDPAACAATCPAQCHDAHSNPDQADKDNDCVGDGCDNCPSIANNDQKDTDNDGVGDVCDNCPVVANGPKPRLVCTGTPKGLSGTTKDDPGCQLVVTDNQLDTNGDGVGDDCQGDYDGDGVKDDGFGDGIDNNQPCTTGHTIGCDDNCRNVPNPDQKDSDGDGIGDACDNCFATPNPDQTDVIAEYCEGSSGPLEANRVGADNVCPKFGSADQPQPDQRGDACDDELDGDGIPNVEDNCMAAPNPDQKDSDGDLIGDACDQCPKDWNPDQDNRACQRPTDFDTDGIPNSQDNCPLDYNPGQQSFSVDQLVYCKPPYRDPSECLSATNVRIGQACMNSCLKLKFDYYPDYGQPYYNYGSPIGNTYSADCDQDGIVDHFSVDDCSDSNIYRGCDNCPKVSNPDQTDTDGDGIGDACDNCPNIYNIEQHDSVGNGIGDDCRFCNNDNVCNSDQGENSFNCSHDCPVVCGNNVIEFWAGEVCDDGNAVDGDGCDSNCKPTGCGNGIVVGDENCEPGVADCSQGSYCNTSNYQIPLCQCKQTICGDGVIDPGEACDDGNTTSGDGCSGTCQTEFCGDGVINNTHEQCDGSNDPCKVLLGDTAYCIGSSSPPPPPPPPPPKIIGVKGIAGPVPVPVPGPTDLTCTCKTPICGDGILDPGEDCDDGQFNSDTNPYACPTTCKFPVCGDGIVGGAEQCDGSDAPCQVGLGAASHYCEADSCRCKGYCGDGVCDQDKGETADNCYADCSSCGDGFCDSRFSILENPDSCSADCSAMPQTCGDGVCVSGEDIHNCLGDCSKTDDTVCDFFIVNLRGLTYIPEDPHTSYDDCHLCGDGYCDADYGETNENCPDDCTVVLSGCGDGTCDEGENSNNCYVDCWRCDDHVCDGVRGENSTNCPLDCYTPGLGFKSAPPPSPFCNFNGTCEPGFGENIEDCRADCGSACGDAFCDASIGENQTTCSSDCHAVGDGVCDTRYESAVSSDPNYSPDCHGLPSSCGNGACDNGETIQTCYADCHLGDGVCDLGFDELTTGDCTCGNGVLDAGEACDLVDPTGDTCAATGQVCNSCNACVDGGGVKGEKG